MSTLLEQVTNAWKDAMKSGDAVRKDTLSSLRAAIKSGEINSRGSGTEFDEGAAQATIEKEAKKRREAITEYEKAGRTDLAEREAAELAVITEFLPEQLTEAELAELVQATIAETGASSPKDMGKVMGILVPKIAGRADGKVASALVKQHLSGQ